MPRLRWRQPVKGHHVLNIGWVSDKVGTVEPVITSPHTQVLLVDELSVALSVGVANTLVDNLLAVRRTGWRSSLSSRIRLLPNGWRPDVFCWKPAVHAGKARSERLGIPRNSPVPILARSISAQSSHDRPVIGRADQDSFFQLSIGINVRCDGEARSHSSRAMKVQNPKRAAR